MSEIEKIRALYEHELLGVREVAERLSLRPWHVYRVMKQQGIARQRGAAQNFATYKTKPQFVPRASLTTEEEQLRIAGIMLYRAEGVKRGGTVDFANSDPQLTAIFIAFLRRICGVAEKRLRVLLYAYDDQDVAALKRYWSHTTGIPLAQFTKPHIRQAPAQGVHRKMSHGLVHIRYNDTRLLQLILDWSHQFANIWAGT